MLATHGRSRHRNRLNGRRQRRIGIWRVGEDGAGKAGVGNARKAGSCDHVNPVKTVDDACR